MNVLYAASTLRRLNEQYSDARGNFRQHAEIMIQTSPGKAELPADLILHFLHWCSAALHTCA